MIPVICVVGKPNSGKTTLLEGLVPEFKTRGYQVAVARHSHGALDVGVGGDDSWRLLGTKADLVVLSSPVAHAEVRSAAADTPLEVLAESLGGCDLLLAEGFKASPLPKIEVHRPELGPDLLCTEDQLLAVVSDNPPPVAVRTFLTSQVKGLADFLEERCLRSQAIAEEVRLVVDGQPVHLSPFAQTIISRAVLGMVSSLRGVHSLRKINLWIRVPPGG